LSKKLAWKIEIEKILNRKFLKVRQRKTLGRQSKLRKREKNYKLLKLTKIQVETGNWDLNGPFDVPNPYK
jgi:hypothetical protein